MKKAGKNIINDEDINMTYLESLGKTLKGEMHDLRRDVDELKGNVKFFSKYGGFGNGGGGGGGGTNTSSGWYISASLDNGQYPFNSNVQSNEISLESTGEHTLHVKIARPNGGTFNVTYSWFNGSSTSTRSVVLDASNSWTLPDIAPLFLGGSKGVVTVTASDGVDSYTAQLPYLTSAFAFSLTLAKDDAQNTVITDSDVFTEDVTRDGLKAKLHYDVGIDADVKYKVTDINGVVWDEDKLDLTSSTVGDILMDVSKIKDFVTDDANAGSYTFSVQVTIAPRLQRPITFARRVSRMPVHRREHSRDAIAAAISAQKLLRPIGEHRNGRPADGTHEDVLRSGALASVRRCGGVGVLVFAVLGLPACATSGGAQLGRPITRGATGCSFPYRGRGVL
jgi:hypothetical protein